MKNKLYCGMDFHKKDTELCVMDGDGKIVEQVRVASTKLVQFLSNRKEYHIGIESSGGVFDISSKLEAAGHKVTIINPSQFRGIGITGKKNDKNDAKALATALRLGFVPEVYKKTLYARQVKSLLVSRDLVVKLRISVTNHIRGILREYGVVMNAGPDSFWKESNKKVQELECPIMRDVLMSLLDQATELRNKEASIEQSLNLLTENDERITRLQTVPGVGRITAAAFVATIDDTARFSDARKVGSYLGLTPRENSSGNKVKFGSITKCGPELVRRYLIHGARAVFRYKDVPNNKIRAWASRVEKRSGTNKAVVAVAHKNARIMFSMLKNGTSFGEKKNKIQKNEDATKDLAA
jgi:transposase